MKNLVVLFLLLASNLLYGQELTGTVKEKGGLQLPVPYAKLFFVDFGVHILTDSLGNWEIDNVPEGQHRIEFSAMGFETVVLPLDFKVGFPVIVYLEKGHRELDKVIVSNNGVLQGESITPVESLGLNQVNSIPTSTLGQTLTNIPGVSETGIGVGVSKPVIRGLSGSSIVTYINGLRIQNQQWGGDHGLPITSLGIGHAEVIKGPASLLYGADALGGVLYFVDEPYAARNTSSGFVQTQFDHNNFGTSNQAGLRLSKKALRLNVYGGYDNFADYQLPNGNYATNSRFKQSSAKLALGYNKKKWVINLRYNFYNARIGLPGHTHDIDPDPLSFETTVQNRKDNVPAQRVQNHFTSVENIFFLGKSQLNVLIGNTNNALKEHEEKFTSPDIIINLNNTVYNAKWKYRFNKKMDFILGSQGMLQINRNGVNAVDRLIPDANTIDVGAYGLFSVKLMKWHFQAGARFDNRKIDVVEQATTFSADYQGLNYAVGMARLAKKTSIRFNVSSGFRAPNTSELLSDGVHHGAFRYERGSALLTTEKAVQFDASFMTHFDDFEFSLNPFYTQLNDYIYLEKTDSLIEDFEVYDYRQAKFARRYGGEVAMHYHPHFAHWIHLESNFATVFAEDEEQNPIPLVPHATLNSQLRFEFGMTTKLQITAITIQHLHFFQQDRVGSLETPSPAYSILNAGMTLKLDLSNPIFFSFGVRNMLNQKYINHLSGLKPLGIAGPGYALYFSLKYEFKQQHKNK